ncbi:MAG: zinc-ribbon domain-containing protein [Clostridiaceae bacterium]|nr:zinc-ribbon domain-containing protein [Clostridiaceae bacterium]
MSLYSHCLKHQKDHLLEQWDAEKNFPLSPKILAATSTERVWWKCEKGHSWQTQLSSRVRGSTGCPVCLREKIDSRMEKRRTDKTGKKQQKKSNVGGKEK